jgi:hypothetical protein
MDGLNRGLGGERDEGGEISEGAGQDWCTDRR